MREQVCGALWEAGGERGPRSAVATPAFILLNWVEKTPKSLGHGRVSDVLQVSVRPNTMEGVAMHRSDTRKSRWGIAASALVAAALCCAPAVSLAHGGDVEGYEPGTVVSLRIDDASPRSYQETVIDRYTSWICLTNQHSQKYYRVTYKELWFPNTFTRSDVLVSSVRAEGPCSCGGYANEYVCHYDIS